MDVRGNEALPSWFQDTTTIESIIGDDYRSARWLRETRRLSPIAPRSWWVQHHPGGYHTQWYVQGYQYWCLGLPPGACLTMLSRCLTVPTSPPSMGGKLNLLPPHSNFRWGGSWIYFPPIWGFCGCKIILLPPHRNGGEMQSLPNPTKFRRRFWSKSMVL